MFQTLPADIYWEIFIHLDYKTLHLIRRVNRRFNRVIVNSRFWCGHLWCVAKRPQKSLHDFSVSHRLTYGVKPWSGYVMVATKRIGVLVGSDEFLSNKECLQKARDSYVYLYYAKKYGSYTDREFIRLVYEARRHPTSEGYVRRDLLYVSNILVQAQKYLKSSSSLSDLVPSRDTILILSYLAGKWDDHNLQDILLEFGLEEANIPYVPLGRNLWKRPSHLCASGLLKVIKEAIENGQMSV